MAHIRLDGAERFNRVKPWSNALLVGLFLLLALVAVVPLVFVGMISLSSEASITEWGYRFWPKEFSLFAYEYLWQQRADIGNSLFSSLTVTIGGTLIGLYLNASMGYVLSRKTFRFRGFYTWLIIIPMLFSGGMVASFVINTQLLHLRNTYWALILPLTVTTFNIIILRTFFLTTVPDSIIESGKIDGANQFLIFFRLVLPVSLPAMATIGLFLTFCYWNDWFQAMLYLQSDHAHMYPLQYLLISIEKSIEFMTRNAQYMTPSAQGGHLPRETARMAIVMIVVLPIACSYPFFQRYFITGLTIGSVKG